MPRNAILLTILFLLAPAALGGTLRLRDSATIDPGAALTLGDVALLEGADTSGLASMAIALPGGPAAFERTGFVEISLAQVRGVLDAAGVPLGRLAISGNTCSVRVRKEVTPQASDRGAASDLGAGDPNAENVRAAVVRSLARLFRVEPVDLRVSFAEGDASLLDTPALGRTLVASPISSPGAPRAALQIRVMDGQSIVLSRTIHAQVLLRQQVMVLQRELRRAEQIAPGDAISEERWLAPASGPAIQSLEGWEGALARTRLEVGTVLRPEHLETPVLIRRNELATVYSLAQGFEVRAKARAKDQGRKGDLIEFQIEGSKRTFRARVDGPGVAVADLSERAATDTKPGTDPRGKAAGPEADGGARMAPVQEPR